MTDLDRAEIDDPWSDVGYEPHEHGPAPARDDDLVRCPFCDHTDGHQQISRPPGILCGACGNHFTSAPGEYEGMRARRRLWAEETRRAG